MKKLLSILASVGLVATTGATVVACGPNENDTDKDAFKITISGDKIVGKKGTIKIENYEKVKDTYKEFNLVIDESSANKEAIGEVNFNKEVGEFTFVGFQKGEVKVTVSVELTETKANTLVDKNLSNPLTIKIDTFKISEIEVGEFDIKQGDKLEEVEKTILEKINAVVKLAEQGKDYTVSADVKDGLITGGNVIIESATNSKYIQKSLTIKVKTVQKSIKDIKIEDLVAGTTNLDVKKRIQDEIVVLAEDVEPEDYNIEGLEGEDNATVAEGQEITVTAVQKSSLIKDAFTFTIIAESKN